ncbi:hypothetical protein TSUD_296570 [Trifolium subterraneum]|uniref:DNA replication factor Cdt1 C-terminal domain-containing protein n=1 Tax=Trifolium subterraneum TaxID=3900 RepID=A0A2Z6N074_TRISU|nr:hypothetical protein TSUD_296570 [Trifolium subterraneum]
MKYILPNGMEELVYEAGFEDHLGFQYLYSTRMLCFVISYGRYFSQKNAVNQTEQVQWFGCIGSDDNPLTSLVGLVNVIGSIFISVKRTPITKEELLQKIMMNCLDFVEISKAEEKIEILEKIVPDWLCKKLVSSVDTMHCVKNAVDLESIRSRLVSNVTKGDE